MVGEGYIILYIVYAVYVGYVTYITYNTYITYIRIRTLISKVMEYSFVFKDP